MSKPTKRRDPSDYLAQRFGKKQVNLPEVGQSIPIVRDLAKQYWKYYCPLCGCERRMAQGPNPGQAKHFVQIGLTTAMVTLMTWQLFEWKGIVSFIPIWIVFETLYRLRVRAQMTCSQCGFDPFLYLTDTTRARGEVEAFWRTRFKERGIAYPGDASQVAPENPPSG